MLPSIRPRGGTSPAARLRAPAVGDVAEIELLKLSWVQGGALLALFMSMAIALGVVWRALSTAQARCQALSDLRCDDLKLLIPAVRTLEELTRAIGDRRRL